MAADLVGEVRCNAQICVTIICRVSGKCTCQNGSYIHVCSHVVSFCFIK